MQKRNREVQSCDEVEAYQKWPGCKTENERVNCIRLVFFSVKAKDPLVRMSPQSPVMSSTFMNSCLFRSTYED